jgi:sec-independent protein translocase protein TatB
MRTAGRWIGKVRRVSSHFRTGIDAMVREAELEDMEKKWKAQNEAIMKQSAADIEAEKGEPVMTGPPPTADAESAAKETAKAIEPSPPPVAPAVPEAKSRAKAPSEPKASSSASAEEPAKPAD